jgi:hypothetical protein
MCVSGWGVRRFEVARGSGEERSVRAAGLFKEEQRQCSPYTSSRDRRGQAVRFIGTDENVACSGNLAAAFSTVSV